jgi:hypothetical protein
MKTLSAIILIIIFPIIGFSQIEILAEGFVNHASVNGIDISEIAKENEQEIVFYTSDDGLIYMSNFWVKSNSQSYGELTSTKKTKKTTYHSYKAEVEYFIWHYSNTYDTVEGDAKVKLTKIFKPEGVGFIMEIFPENNDDLVYKGVLKGELE